MPLVQPMVAALGLVQKLTHANTLVAAMTLAKNIPMDLSDLLQAMAADLPLISVTILSESTCGGR